MALSATQLREQIEAKLVAIATLRPQQQAAQAAVDEAAATRDNLDQALRYHESVLAGLKNNLYAFFESTFVANPNATSYAELGAAMDAEAAANPETPPPPEEPPQEPAAAPEESPTELPPEEPQPEGE